MNKYEKFKKVCYNNEIKKSTNFDGVFTWSKSFEEITLDLETKTFQKLLLHFLQHVEWLDQNSNGLKVFKLSLTLASSPMHILPLHYHH